MTEDQAQQKIQNLCALSDETMGRLHQYADLLEQWNPKINLVSKTTLPEKWQRHFLDSAQVWPHIPQNTRHLVDIGSGAGFAGLVLAVIAAEKAPDMRITLVESDARKCAFMRNAARQMGISPEIRTERIETLQDIGADVLTARALAPIGQLLAYSRGILHEKGHCVFLKGGAYAKEIELAKESWNFSAEISESLTHEAGVIVKLMGIGRG